MVVCRRMDSGKCSPRRLPVWNKLAVLALALASIAGALPAFAQTADGLAILETFLAQVHTLKADFRQELWSADQKLQQTETGTLELNRPNRFRWRYAAPTELLVVADGQKLWMYDVELKQVTVAPLDASTTSSPAMLLSGGKAVRDGFDVVRTATRDGLDLIELSPKQSGGDFTSISIAFDHGVPKRLELVDGLNQVTKIELSNVATNPEIAAAEFQFTPPAGVDVIGGG